MFSYEQFMFVNVIFSFCNASRHPTLQLYTNCHLHTRPSPLAASATTPASIVKAEDPATLRKSKLSPAGLTVNRAVGRIRLSRPLP